MLKYLRIAVTALCLTACVLLIGLWVRSFRGYDAALVSFTPKSWASPYYYSRDAYAFSCYGVVSVGTREWSRSADQPQWEIVSSPDPPGSRPARFGGDNEPWRFEFDGGKFWELGVNVPHWFLVALSALSGIAPWIHWSKRFSLRTLLIATTLVAVGLGLIVLAV